jgi:xylulokinase
VGGGGITRWLAGILRPQGEGVDSAEYFAQMDQWAGQVPAGAEGLLFLPYMAGERSPIWDENAKAVYFGLDYTKNRGHIIRASLEGAAFALRHNIEAAGEAASTIEEMRSVGGAAKSRIWMQIKADVTGKPIRPAGGDLATAKGALILAGVGTGILPSFEKACERFVRLGPVYYPDATNKAHYDTAYNRYLLLYTQLKELMRGC